MRKICKILLPLLAFVIPGNKAFSNANIETQNNEDQFNNNEDSSVKKQRPILYKFVSGDNSIIQFIKHTSHRSHRSHRSGSTGGSGKSRSSSSRSSSTYIAPVTTEPDYNVNYDNPRYAEEKYAYAYTDLNVRRGPSLESGLVISIKKDTKVTILSRKEMPWVKIEVYGYEGYVNAKYLKYNLQ